jgi:hypothetical protein
MAAWTGNTPADTYDEGLHRDSADGRIALGDNTLLPLKIATGSTGTIEVGGHLIWTTDATYDLGASGATRPRDLYLSRNAVIGGTLGVTGNVTLTAQLDVEGYAAFGNGQAPNANFSLIVDRNFVATSHGTQHHITGDISGLDAATAADGLGMYGLSFAWDSGVTGIRATTAYFSPPTLTLPGGASVPVAATVYVAGTPSGGDENWGLYVTAEARLTGGVVIGANSTNNKIDDASTGGGSATLYIGNASINVTSDVRLKNVVGLTDIHALDLLDALVVKDYTWNDPSDTAEVNRNSRGRWTGLMAQDVVKVLPWVVNTQSGGNCAACKAGRPCDKEDHLPWMIDHDQIVPTLVKAIQELSAKIEALELAA